jgi:hypothetical protein
MKNKSKKFIYIDANKYNTIVEEKYENPYEESRLDLMYKDLDLIYKEFDTELGLVYSGMTSLGEYRFRLKNQKKWFLAKIKYGF